MSEGRRPGGLTALAVLNFIFGGLGALSGLALIALVALMGVAADAAAESGDEQAQEALEIWKELGMTWLYAVLLVTLVQAFLLIASGVGYLKQKRMLGRMFGNGYALIAIVFGLAQALSLDPKIGGGFSLMTLVGLIYPVLTLIFLNTTFKEDFINP